MRRVLRLRLFCSVRLGRMSDDFLLPEKTPPCARQVGCYNEYVSLRRVPVNFRGLSPSPKGFRPKKRKPDALGTGHSQKKEATMLIMVVVVLIEPP